MKKYKIVNKKRFYVFIIFAMYSSFMALSFFRSFGTAQKFSNKFRYEEVYISQGDTVWDIALQHNPSRIDVRDMVAEIKDFNELKDVGIKPGDIIKIPLRKK